MTPTEFITPAFGKKAADILFSAKTQTGQDVCLYFLFEHLRMPDRFLPLRLMLYLILITDRHMRRTKAKVLPLIVPIVLYNGDRSYPFSTSFFDLYHPEQRAEAERIMNSPIQLIDLTQFNFAGLEDEGWIDAALKALKWAPRKGGLCDLTEALQAPFARLADEEAMDYIRDIVYYISDVKELESAESVWEEFKTAFSPKLSEEFMQTIGSMLKKKGVEEGILLGLKEGREKGREEGLEEGVQKAKVEAALEMLRDGMPIEQVTKFTKLGEGFVRDLLNGLGEK